MQRVNAIHPDLLHRRDHCLATNFDLFAIQHASPRELLSTQTMLGYGDRWGVWEVPLTWLPPTFRTPAGHTVSIDTSTDLGCRMWTEVLRFMLLCSLVCGRKGRPDKATTVIYNGKSALRLLPLLSTNLTAQSSSWWGYLTDCQIISVLGRKGTDIATRLRGLHHRGFLSESPRKRTFDENSIERNRFGESAPENMVNDPDEYQPLPDEFVAQCGRRVLWFITNIGPTLLDCVDACLRVKAPPDRFYHSDRGGRTARNTEQLVIKARGQLISEWVWIDFQGTPIQELTFDLVMKRTISRNVFTKFSWPPRSWMEVIRLCKILQACHAWILLLASGPRVSTLLSYTSSSYTESFGVARVEAHLYKTQQAISGRLRDWPAPPRVAQALKQQIRLAALARTMSDPNSVQDDDRQIWLMLRSSRLSRLGDPLAGLNKDLDGLVHTFKLAHLLDGRRLHSHRFRKTLARIIALALTDAQLILMDCFGHDDPQMTLGYMTADKAIIGDALRMQRELVVLMARDAILSPDELGGPVASKVREAKASFLRVRRKSCLDPNDAFELAESLTADGRTWAIVMPGVICTLPMGITGPCGLRQGGRDPGHCQSGCGHQLLLARHKTECHDTVEFIVEQLQRAVDIDSITVTMWQGQLRNWLYRWDEVYQAWADHPMVIRFGDPAVLIGGATK